MTAGAWGSGENVLVIGLGRTGLACVEVLRARGAQVFAVDEKPVAQLSDQIEEVRRFGAAFVAPARLPDVFSVLNAAVLSPGVPMSGDLVRRVRAAGIPLLSEIELAYRLSVSPIVAVTGTKGKSTTTALIGHLLLASGKRAYVGGNIGNPLIHEVLKAGPNDCVVAEVSSFQLEAVHEFKPRVAVLLNLSADHLDRYASMDEYADAKFRIFRNQDFEDTFVANIADGRLEPLHWSNAASPVKAKQMWFGPSADGRASMYVREGAIVYAPRAGEPVEVLRVENVPLAGSHNVDNVMAALLAAVALGSDPHVVGEAVRSFSPMPHRLEVVERVEDVIYVNDSKATNPGSVIAALHAYDAPVHLIAGGKSKNTDFSDLGRAVDECAKTLIVFGEAAEEIASSVERTKTVHVATLEEAVRTARSLAAPGEIVLLSPGCASFDMFASAEERGRRFAAAVRALRETAGA